MRYKTSPKPDIKQFLLLIPDSLLILLTSAIKRPSVFLGDLNEIPEHNLPLISVQHLK